MPIGCCARLFLSSLRHACHGGINDGSFFEIEAASVLVDITDEREKKNKRQAHKAS